MLDHGAQNTERRRSGVKDPTAVTHNDLERSPAEIDERRRTTETAAHPCTRARVSKTRLLVPRNDLDVDAEARANLGDERVPVARFANGAGRDRENGLRWRQSGRA